MAETHAGWTPDGSPEPVPSEDAIINAIGTVYDPEIPVNIYELGLIYAIEISDEGRVKVEMTLTAPGCPSAQELPVQAREAIMAVPGVTGLRGGDGLGAGLGPRPACRKKPASSLNMF